MPTPRFARKFSTWNPPSQEEGAYPQNCMQSRNQVSEMLFGKFPSPSTFECWKTSFKLSYGRYVVGNKEVEQGVDSRILRCLRSTLTNSTPNLCVCAFVGSFCETLAACPGCGGPGRRSWGGPGVQGRSGGPGEGSLGGGGGGPLENGEGKYVVAANQ